MNIIRSNRWYTVIGPCKVTSGDVVNLQTASIQKKNNTIYSNQDIKSLSDINKLE